MFLLVGPVVSSVKLNGENIMRCLLIEIQGTLNFSMVNREKVIYRDNCKCEVTLL